MLPERLLPLFGILMAVSLTYLLLASAQIGPQGLCQSFCALILDFVAGGAAFAIVFLLACHGEVPIKF
ncbi:MAG: hypothetical protein V6Z86_10150 [Hyphomicrobiales bacterium]